MKSSSFVLAGMLLASLTGCQKNDEAQQRPSNDILEKNFSLARVYFRLPEMYALPDSKELGKLLLDRRKQDALKSAFALLQTNATIRVFSQKDKPVVATNELRLVSVNNRILTKEDSKEIVSLHLQLAKIREKKMGSDAQKRLQSKLVKTAIPHFVQCELWADYARANGIRLTEQQVVSNQNAFARACHIGSFEQLCKKLTPQQSRRLSEEMSRSLLMDVAKKHVLSQVSQELAPDEIDAVSNRFAHIRATAQATNDLVWASASNAWKRIVSHEITFQEAVVDYTEEDHAEDDGSWGSFKVTDLKDEPQLVRFLQTAQKNDVSPPLECDNGLCLVKVLKIEKTRPQNANVQKE